MKGYKAKFFNTRIVRITEVFLYLRNLYKKMGIPFNEKINIEIAHHGLMNRILMASSNRRSLFKEYKIIEDTVPTSILFSLQDIDENIVELVELFTKPLFALFDFFELDKKVFRRDCYKLHKWEGCLIHTFFKQVVCIF